MSQKPKKLLFSQICLNFPPKLALHEIFFFPCDYILMKGNLRKVTQQTHFVLSRAVET